MALTLNQLTKQALDLPAASRARLAEQLVESLADAAPDEISNLWADEAIRRRDEVRSGRVKALSGEQASGEIRQ